MKQISFGKTYTLTSHFNAGNKAMELSELIAFNGKLYSCDDRTGVIFEVSHDYQMLPFVMLKDGNGKNSKGEYELVSFLVSMSKFVFYLSF